MSTNSKIAKTYPKHFDPNPESIWDKIEARLATNQQEQEDTEDDEFSFSDLSSNDE